MSDPLLREKQYLDAIAKNIQESTNDVFDSLVSNSDNNVLPENIFVQYFLPYFSGKLPITKQTSVMTDWVSVAGSPVAEVDIIDQQNQVLFTVPSLFDTKIINPIRGDESESISQIYNQYSLKNNNIPIVATRYLSNAMDSKSEEILNEVQQKDTRWDNILNRYGIESPNQQKKITSIEEEPEDDLIYD